MPLGAMGSNVNNLLATLNQTLKEADALLSHVDSQLVPQGTKTMEALHRTIADAIESPLARMPRLRRICTT